MSKQAQERMPGARPLTMSTEQERAYRAKVQPGDMEAMALELDVERAAHDSTRERLNHMHDCLSDARETAEADRAALRAERARSAGLVAALDGVLPGLRLALECERSDGAAATMRAGIDAAEAAIAKARGGAA